MESLKKLLYQNPVKGHLTQPMSSVRKRDIASANGGVGMWKAVQEYDKTGNESAMDAYLKSGSNAKSGR